MVTIANRIDLGITRIEKQISEKMLAPEKLAHMHNTFNVSTDEYVIFQELKSAVTGVILTLEESHTIYGYLGNTAESFNRQPIAVKVAITKTMKEIMERF